MWHNVAHNAQLQQRALALRQRAALRERARRGRVRVLERGDGAEGTARSEERTTMAKNKAQAEALAAPAAEALAAPDDAFGPVVVHPDVEADNAKARSVVGVGYKKRYAERAVANGLRSKAAQRSAWDWLAETLAGECLDDKARISIERFLAILDANGVDHSRWQNRSKGWEGRLRMTGRLALQRVVAEAMVLKTADGEELVPPAEWVAKYAR